MKWLCILVFSLSVALPAFAGDECAAVYGAGTHAFSLATGSPGELGMLKAIAEVFNPKYDTRLCQHRQNPGEIFFPGG